MKKKPQGLVFLFSMVMALCLSVFCFVPQLFAAPAVIPYNHDTNDGQAAAVNLDLQRDKAGWEVVDLTLTYDADDGGATALWSDSKPQYRDSAGNNYENPAFTAAKAPARPGYTFRYWTIEGTGIKYYQGMSVLVSENTTLKAVWTLEQDTVAWDFRTNQLHNWTSWGTHTALPGNNGLLLTMTPQGGGGALNAPMVSLDTARYKVLIIGVNHATAAKMKLYYRCDNNQHSEANTFEIPLIQKDSFHEYVFDLSTMTNWNGIAKHFMLSLPSGNAGIAYIKLAASSPQTGWEFANDTAGWAAGQIGGVTDYSVTQGNHALIVRNMGVHGKGMVNMPFCSIAAENYGHLVLGVKSASADTNLKIYFYGNTMGGYHESRTTSIALSAAAGFREYHIDCSALGFWNGSFNKAMIVTDSVVTLQFDYIRFAKKDPRISDHPDAEEEGPKIMLLGNSILEHDVNSAIGWNNKWGMAASAQEKDYVHRLMDHYVKNTYGKLDYRLFSLARLERSMDRGNTQGYNYDTELVSLRQAVLAYQPDIVNLQMGENVSSNLTAAQYKAELVALIETIQEASPGVRVMLCTSFWGGAAKVAGAEQARLEKNIPLTSLEGLNNNAFKAIGEYANEGVAAHPNDRGMEEIAKRIWANLDPVIEEKLRD